MTSVETASPAGTGQAPKRLAFFFDGTTNTLDARFTTNVVKLAQSIAPISKKGVSQLI